MRQFSEIPSRHSSTWGPGTVIGFLVQNSEGACPPVPEGLSPSNVGYVLWLIHQLLNDESIRGRLCVAYFAI